MCLRVCSETFFFLFKFCAIDSVHLTTSHEHERRMIKQLKRVPFERAVKFFEVNASGSSWPSFVSLTCVASRRLAFSDVVFLLRLRKLLVPRGTRHERPWLCSTILTLYPDWMPLTRSASRAAALYDGLSNVKAMDSIKRRAEEPRSNPSKKRLRSQKTSADDAYKTSLSASTSSKQFLPATLKFSFEEGKQHLISVDSRFEKLFNRTQCKPFEQLETVHPFRCEYSYPWEDDNL